MNAKNTITTHDLTFMFLHVIRMELDLTTVQNFI